MNRTAVRELVGFASVTLALWGCGAPESSPAPSDPQVIVLGTGEAEYASIEGEPWLPLVAGVQGGFHVWASFLAYGFTSPNVDIVFTTTLEEPPGSRIVLRASLQMKGTIDADGTAVYSVAGFPAQVPDARCAHGKRVRLDVTVADADGRISEDTRHCIAELEEARRSPNCS